MIGSKKMQRDIGLVANDPAVMSGRNVEDLPRPHFDNPSVVHGGRGAAGNDHSDMLDSAGSLAKWLADMLRPSPAGVIGRPPDRHSTDIHYLEPAELEFAHFVGSLEALED